MIVTRSSMEIGVGAEAGAVPEGAGEGDGVANASNIRSTIIA